MRVSISSFSYWVVATLATVLTTLPPREGHCDLVYATSFEAPTFTVGSSINGIDGWSTPIAPAPAPNLNAPAALVAVGPVFSGLQSLRIQGSDMVASGAAVSPYDSIGSYRKLLNYDGTGQVVRLSTMIRIDGLTTPTDLFSASLSARVGGATVGEIELFSNGLVGTFGNVAPGSLPTETQVASLNAWHELAMDVDFNSRQTRFFLNGNPFATSIAFSPSSIGNQLERSSLVVYARPDAGPFARTAYSASYDSLSVTAVPEPSSFLLTALVVAGTSHGLIRRRRNRRCEGARELKPNSELT